MQIRGFTCLVPLILACLLYGNLRLINRLPDRSRNGGYMFPCDIGNQLFVSMHPRPFAVSRLANRFSSLGGAWNRLWMCTCAIADYYCVHRFVRYSLFANAFTIWLACQSKPPYVTYCGVPHSETAVCIHIYVPSTVTMHALSPITSQLALTWHRGVCVSTRRLSFSPLWRPLAIVLYLYFH